MSKSKKGKKQRTIDTLEKQLASRDKSIKAYSEAIDVQLDKIVKQKVDLMEQSTLIKGLRFKNGGLRVAVSEAWYAAVAALFLLAIACIKLYTVLG